MTLEEFKDVLLASRPADFARHQLLNEDCWVFEQGPQSARGLYSEFRSEIADLLDINPRCVAIIGSAKFGWSMSPSKFGNAYIHDVSDIDIVLVSGLLFNDAWHQIRQAYYGGYTVLQKTHARETFARYLVLKNIDYNSSYLRNLQIKLSDLNRIVNKYLGVEDKANYRIYYDWSDVELYHAKGLLSLQGEIGNIDA